MATKQFYATGDFRYGTRMMRAGDPVQMDGPTARLYTALKKISPTKPRAAKPYDPREETVEQFEKRKAPAPKKAPAKRKATRRKKTA